MERPRRCPRSETVSGQLTTRAPAEDRAIRLFRFLMHAQETRDEPARTVDAYRRDGSVLWFGDLPATPRCTPRWTRASPRWGGPIGDRAAAARRPPVPGRVSNTGSTASSTTRALHQGSALPSRSHRRVRCGRTSGRTGRDHDDQPEIVEAFQLWLEQWSAWADQERRDSEVRDLYSTVFAMYVNALGHAEELELIVGVGGLAWTPRAIPWYCGTC